MENRAWGQFKLDGVKLLDGEADSPLSEYALTVSTSPHWHGGEPKAMIHPADGPAPEPKAPKIDHDSSIKKLGKLFEDADTLDYLKLEGIEPIAGDGGPDRARYLAIYNRMVVHNTKEMRGADVSEAEGGWQIEYENEDPTIYELFEKECAKNGSKVILPSLVRA